MNLSADVQFMTSNNKLINELESNLLECAVYTQQTVISCNLIQLVN